MHYNPRNIYLDRKQDNFDIIGSGTTIALFDDGFVNPKFFGERFINIHGKKNTGNHAAKVASVCAYGSNVLEEEPILGVAPGAKVICVDYGTVFPDHYGSILQHIYYQHGKIDISGHAYSGVESNYLNRVVKEQFYELTADDQSIGHLVVAAAGHDGLKGVRFPACINSVLAVGVCDSNYFPTPYCSINTTIKKPEIMVPDYHYLAKLEEFKVGKINGTSAAVGILVGLASLWSGYLRTLGQKPYPSFLKAILLSVSDPSPLKPHRVISPMNNSIELSRFLSFSFLGKPAISNIVATKAIFDDKEPFVLFLEASSDVVTAAFVELQETTLIRRPKSIITMEIHTDSSVITEESSYWVVSDCAIQRGKQLSIQLKSKNELHKGYLVVTGVKDKIEKNYGVINLMKEKTPEMDKLSISKNLAPKSLIKPKPLIIVGISASHDASACIIKDGKLMHAIHLERLTRTKRDGVGFLHSEQAIRYCLEALNITEKEVDYFAFNSQPLLPSYVGLSQPTHDESFKLFNPFSDRCIYVSHHLAHAFSTFFASPFEQAAVCIYDGSGGSTVGTDDLLIFGNQLENYLNQGFHERPLLHVQSSYIFNKEGFSLIDREYAPSFNIRSGSSSLGETFASVSQYIFGDWQEGGKVMGLAPYGNPSAYGPSLLQTDESCLLQFKSNWKNNYRNILSRLDPMNYKDLAARIQLDLEEALIQRFKKLKEKTEMTQVAYAGGLALNCVANERIRKESGFKDMYIFPASGDAGISVGAAAAALFKLTNSTQRQEMPHVFLGFPYSEDMYLEAVKNYDEYVSISRITITEIVEKIAQGKIFGLFEGGSEFGPRALGHRSIIADPRSADTWRFINRWIKYREDFRPFAPAVPLEQASIFFEIDTPSPFMLRTVRVRSEHQKNLGAITHVNGTARVQTVDSKVLPRFHQILCQFGEITGYPILVNTSLNVRNQPLVETPIQAIELLLSTNLDGIIFENYLIVPQFPSNIKLTGTDVIIIAPDIKIVKERSFIKQKSMLQSQYRKSNNIEIEDWQYHLLYCLNGKKTIEETINEVNTIHKLDYSQCMKWLQSLLLTRIIFKTNKKIG